MIIPAEKIDPILDKKYSELSRNVKIPGFRPGKVPLQIIKKRYSKTVLSETLDGLINDNLRQALIEKKIKPAVQPTVNIESYEEGKDLNLKVIIQKMPVLKKYCLIKLLLRNQL